MAATDPIKDLSRTAAAIEAYDAFDATSNSKEWDLKPLEFLEQASK